MPRKVKTYVAPSHPSNETKNHACGHHHSAQEIAVAFAKQYYEILRLFPQKTNKFYTDESVVSRPTGADRSLRSVTTVKAINKEIMGSFLKNRVVNLLAVNGQDTIGDSVIVVVVGLLNTDNMMKCFTQTFFLAPQEEGFYVKNDIFHLLIPNDTEGSPVPVEDKGTSTDGIDAFNQITEDSTDTKKSVLLDEPNKISATPIASSVSDTQKDVKKVSYASIVAKNRPLPSQNAIVSKKTDAQSSVPLIIVKDTTIESALKILEKDNNDKSSGKEDVIGIKKGEVERNAPPNAEEVEKKESYASIVTKTISLPINPPASGPDLKDKSSGFVPGTTESSSNPAKPSDVPCIVKAIYIKDVPPYVTRKLLTQAVKEFGPVKHKNIQIRRYGDGYRYAFVEFNHPNSAHLAVQAGCIKFDDWECQVESKKAHMEVAGAEGRDGRGGGGEKNSGNDDGSSNLEV